MTKKINLDNNMANNSTNPSNPKTLNNNQTKATTTNSTLNKPSTSKTKASTNQTRPTKPKTSNTSSRTLAMECNKTITCSFSKVFHLSSHNKYSSFQQCQCNRIVLNNKCRCSSLVVLILVKYLNNNSRCRSSSRSKCNKISLDSSNKVF